MAYGCLDRDVSIFWDNVNLKSQKYNIFVHVHFVHVTVLLCDIFGRNRNNKNDLVPLDFFEPVALKTKGSQSEWWLLEKFGLTTAKKCCDWSVDKFPKNFGVSQSSRHLSTSLI